MHKDEPSCVPNLAYRNSYCATAGHWHRVPVRSGFGDWYFFHVGNQPRSTQPIRWNHCANLAKASGFPR